jgi:superfamily II DNA or RNA helicase
MVYKNHQRIVVPPGLVPSLQEVISKCTVEKTGYDSSGEKVKTQVSVAEAYENIGTLLPRFFPEAIKVDIDNHSKGEPMPGSCRFAGALDKERMQVEATTKTAMQMSKLGGAVLTLPCGFGKTVCGIYLILRFRRKTFVIVHTNELLEQWIERLAQYAPGVKTMRLKETFMENEKGDISIPSDVGVVVGLVQTIAARKCVTTQRMSGFGMVLVDEAHHTPARTMYEAISKFNAWYILGLTATPDRPDGLTNIMYWALGPCAFALRREEANAIIERTNPLSYEVRVCVLRDPVFRAEVPPKNDRDRVVRQKFPFNHQVSRLCGSEARNTLIRDVCVKCEGEGRKVLVLSRRREHAKEIHQLVLKAGGSCGLYIGGMKRKRVDSSKQQVDTFDNQVIVSTYTMFGEGTDVPRLDTLVLATPVSSLEQFLGRVMRAHPDKVLPVLVYDFADEDCHDMIQKMAWGRERQYKKVLGASTVVKKIVVGKDGEMRTTEKQ